MTDPVETPQITGVEVPVDPLEGLYEVEALLSNAATTMLNGPSTKAQRIAFYSFIDEYKGELSRVALDLVEAEMQAHGDETDARTALINLIYDSKHRIVSQAAHDHIKTSKVERARHGMEKTLVRRIAGKGGITAGVVGVSYGLAESVEWITGIQASGIALGATWIASKALRYNQYIRSLTMVPGRKIRQYGFTGIDKTPLVVFNEAAAHVESIDNAEERQKALVDYISDYHLQSEKAALWKELGPRHLGVGQVHETVSVGVNRGIESLLSVHNVEVKYAETQRNVFRKLVDKVSPKIVIEPQSQTE